MSGRKVLAPDGDYGTRPAYQPDGFGSAHMIEQEIVDRLEGFGLVDTSWGNDVCPSWALLTDEDTGEEAFRVWVDAKHPGDREDESLERFGFAVPEGRMTDFTTDDFEMIVKAIEEALA